MRAARSIASDIRDSVPPEVLAAMRADADRVLSRRVRTVGIPYPLLILVFALVTDLGRDHLAVLLAAGGALIGLGFYRYFLSRSFDDQSPEKRRRWRHRFAFASYATAVVWSSFVGFTVLSYGTAWESMLVVLVTLGISAAAVTSISPLLALVRGVLLVVAVPPVVLLPMVAGREGWAMAGAYGVFLAFVLVQCTNHNRQFWSALRDTHLLALGSAELERARQASASASHAKSAFLRNMSHELRTPMNAILGLTRLVLDTRLDAEQMEYLTSVESAGQSLMSLVDQILDYARLDAGHLVIDRAPFLLRDEVHDAIEELAIRAHRRGIGVSVLVDPDVPQETVGDAPRLRQILHHLTDNAVKFTPAGEVTIRIALADPGDPCRVRFAVRDTGIGVSEENHTRIFDAFSQVDATTTRTYGGTGLGLSISSGLVRAMGGEMSLTTAPGEGSEFAFTIPLSVHPTEPRASLDAGLRGTRVLVLERRRIEREHLARLLGAWGFDAVLVEATEAFREEAKAAAWQGCPFRAAILASEAILPEEFDAVLSTLGGLVGLERSALLLVPPGSSPGDLRFDVSRVAGFVRRPVRASDLLDELVRLLTQAEATERLDPASSGSSADQEDGITPILLVEDNHVNRLLALRLLEKGGYRVEVAVNGIEAVDRSARESFGLILMDVSMPEMDGIEATEVIRAREATTGGHVPIVALTAHAMHEDRERCLAAGMDEHVTKPIVSESLFRAVERFIGPPRQGGRDQTLDPAA